MTHYTLFPLHLPLMNLESYLNVEIRWRITQNLAGAENEGPGNSRTSLRPGVARREWRAGGSSSTAPHSHCTPPVMYINNLTWCFVNCLYCCCTAPPLWWILILALWKFMKYKHLQASDQLFMFQEHECVYVKQNWWLRYFWCPLWWTGGQHCDYYYDYYCYYCTYNVYIYIYIYTHTYTHYIYIYIYTYTYTHKCI